VSELWAEEAGDSDHPLVVVIHGSMDRSAGMLKISRRLDTDYRVLRYDRRGYGRSFPHDGPFTMDTQVADLAALLAGRKAVLIGHSYGGNVALATAEQHPDLVAGVAVYETPLSWEAWWPGTTAGAIAIAESGKPHEAAERFLRRMLGDERWDALPERTKHTRRAEGIAMVEELADLRRHRAWDAAHISAPVVVAYGGDGAPHHRMGMRYAATLLGCPVVELAGCRHDAPLSHPDLFRTEVIDPLMLRVGPPWLMTTERPAPTR
jgi:pimeloyl-ACP methyl ester carboxylesterase